MAATCEGPAVKLFRFSLRHKAETEATLEAREALEKVEADAPRVEELRVAHEIRVTRNDFGPKIAAALHLRRTRK